MNIINFHGVNWKILQLTWRLIQGFHGVNRGIVEDDFSNLDTLCPDEHAKKCRSCYAILHFRIPRERAKIRNLFLNLRPLDIVWSPIASLNIIEENSVFFPVGGTINNISYPSVVLLEKLLRSLVAETSNKVLRPVGFNVRARIYLFRG